MSHQSRHFAFLNAGHFLDHYCMLIFATVAVFELPSLWQTDYASIIPLATPGFIAFGVCALPAGWIADRWHREGMMLVFFLGLGLSTILAGLARTPLEMGVALTAMGVFAAIYHPVGLAMVVKGRKNTGMPLAINGVFGNLGVATAALISGYLIEHSGWQGAFVAAGSVSILIGLGYGNFIRTAKAAAVRPDDTTDDKPGDKPGETDSPNPSPASQPVTAAATKESIQISGSSPGFLRVFGIILFTTALGGLVFQSTTFALPKVMQERLSELAMSPTEIGSYTALVFALAAIAQLVVGFLIDRYSARTVFGVVAAVQMCLFWVMIPLDGFAALLVAIGFMLAVFGQIPINDVLVGRLVSDEWRSRAFALRYLVTFTVMASTVPFIAWVYGNWGFGRLFLCLGVAAGFILLATRFLPIMAAKTA